MPVCAYPCALDQIHASLEQLGVMFGILAADENLDGDLASFERF